MDEMVSLRCKYCGAPLEKEQLESDSPYVVCSFCGTSQQRIDAQKYMEEMMVQIKSWVSSAIPFGMSVGGAQSVDPVARHSIFIKDVKPKLESELSIFKFSNMTLLGNPLLVMPFRTGTVCQLEHTSNSAFEFNAKVKSVSELAVSEDDMALVKEAAFVSQSYALAINNVKLLNDQKDGRWGIMANNFRESCKIMNGDKKFELPCARFTALAKVCDGFEKICTGDIASASGYLKEGLEDLTELRNKVMADPYYSIMFTGIDQEINIVSVMSNVLETVFNMDGDPLQMFNTVRKIMDTKPAVNGKWSYLLGSSARYKEVFNSISQAVAAKNGGTIPIAAGAGDVLIPFWEVDLRYTFVTGKLWSKKSVEVKEDLLICADFVMDPACLDDPSSSMTDIFKLRPQASRMDSWKGNETSISDGEGIGKIQDSVSMNGVGSRRIVLPLSTKREAEKMCVEYLAQRTQQDDKFRLSDPVVQRLVYVPCTVNGMDVQLPKDFGALVPTHMKRLDKNKLFII